MNKLEKGFEEPKGRRVTGYSIRGMTDWDQVYQQVESCRERYLNGGLYIAVKRGWRQFADSLGPLQESMKLIPDVDYVTPVRGTLEFIVDAIRRASETRQRLLQGLDKLNSLFQDIELFLITFPTEENVHEAGKDLIVSVLVAVEKLIGFYLKQKGKKIVSALFKGDDYEKDVVDSLYDITSKSENLRHEATKADMSQSARNWKLAEQRSNELLKFQVVLHDGQERIIQNQHFLADDLKKTTTLLNDMLGLTKEHEINMERKIADLQQRNADLEQKLLESEHRADSLHRAHTPVPIMAPNIGWHVTSDGLWHMFGALAFDDIDIQNIQEKQEQIPTHDRAIADSLISIPRFREWMVVAISRKLFVHGVSASNSPISSLSAFCSTLSQALRQNPRFVSLVYFCGLHADYDDPYAGPLCMMMSFVAQLILQGDFDTTFLHNYVDISWAEYGEEPGMDDLCAMLKWLVSRLSVETTLFFVIDGVNAFEKDAYVHDFVDGLACILDMTIDSSIQATVKVLITSPSRTLEVREGFHDDDMVVLTTDRLDTSMGINQRSFQHRVSRVLESGDAGFS
ncbi:hypothetical protein Hte_011165 [Hypoxylon texense]